VRRRVVGDERPLNLKAANTKTRGRRPEARGSLSRTTEDRTTEVGGLVRRSEDGRPCRAEALAYMPTSRISAVAQGFISAEGWVNFTNCPRIKHPEKPGVRHQE